MRPATPLSDRQGLSAGPGSPSQTKRRQLPCLPVSVSVAIGLAALISCGTGATMPVKAVASVSVTLSSDTLIVPNSAIASATLRDAAGNPLSNRAVTWGSSDNTIATVSSAGVVQAVRAGLAVIHASSENVTGSVGLTIIPPPAGISISRSDGSTAGGIVVQITGTGFGAGDSVTFGATPATGVTLVNATTLQATVPPGSPGSVNIKVVHNGVATTLTNGFTYWPAPTTTYAAADFEGGTIPSPFYKDVGTGGSVAPSTAQAHRGTYSALCQATSSGAIAGLSFNEPQSVMISGDFYVRWYILIPAATLTSTGHTGQIKLYLSRQTTGSGQPGWFMLGEGSDFNSNNNSFASRIDDGVIIVATTPPITPGVWHEIEVYQHRDPTTSLGMSRVWYDGQLQGTATSANMGSNDGTVTYWTRMGLGYTQNAASYPLQVYVDDIVAANGFIDPTP